MNFQRTRDYRTAQGRTHSKIMQDTQAGRALSDGALTQFVHTAVLGVPLVGELAGYVEYAGFASTDGSTDYQGYFDAGLTYKLTPDRQLDGGVRVGLTDSSDDFGWFMGISERF